ncbi:MAG: FecR domain-containing protein [Candidatus Lindowbacteria bacterium]|nr:FecR domain-containing protein [Candidatus Lindowbacteria bacterium]
MKGKILVGLLAALVLVFVSGRLQADTIELKSGKIIEGEIVEETDLLVAIEMESGTGFFSKEDIKSINKERLDIAKGKIVEATGTIEVLPKGETEWKPAQKGTPVDEGDSIRSGPNSKAVAVFANQVIMAVEQQSTVNMEKLQQSPKKGINIKANLGEGQIWNDVGRLKTKQSKFFVETSQAVTGVRGTVFTVQVAPDATTKVAVVDGTVDVRTRGIMMSPLKVKENTMTEVAANVAPTTPTSISQDFVAQWNQYKMKFRVMRLGMIGGRLGLSPTQTLYTGVAAVVLVVVIVVLMRMRRRKA